MTTLAQYNRARTALAEATSINEVLPILDEIEHVKLYAKQIADQDLLADASAFQMRAERRLGIVISAAKEAGHFREGRPKKNCSDAEQFPAATLEEVGVDRKLSARAQKAGGIAEQAFEAMVERKRDEIRSGRATPINGARSIMGSRQEPDDSLDYFPTPPWATRALVESVLRHLGVTNLESAFDPACGEGHIAEVLCEYVKPEYVFASDIFAYGYGKAGSKYDYLNPLNIMSGPDWVITNPPFGDKTEMFVLRAIKDACVGTAMFVRLQWLESIGRYENIFRDFPPTLIAFFAERVNLCKGRWDPDGTTATAYIWLVWIKDAKPQAPFWIPPGQREALTRPDDAERFTAQPVIKRGAALPPHDRETGEIVEAAE